MKLGAVIGRVTLSRAVPALIGARWLIVSPYTREHYQRGAQEPLGSGKEPSLVAYDNLGGAVGQTIGYVEGREGPNRSTNRRPWTQSTLRLWTKSSTRPPPSQRPWEKREVGSDES